MQRRTTIWFLLLFQPILVFTQNNHSDPFDCKLGSVNPLSSDSLNACFKLYDTPKSYQAARRHCVSLGGQLAENINKDDSSLYSANADIQVANATQFWVGASNLKCNIAWENGGEIEYNEMWAPNSRYYGVAIDKMSLGGLWHTVPVGQKLPFVCTFQGKPKEAAPAVPAAPVHAMRAPAKKRVARPEKEKEDDIDESLNAAQLDTREKTTPATIQDQKKDKQPMVAADQKATNIAMSASSKNHSSSSDEESDEATISAQLVVNGTDGMSASMSASSSSSNSTSDESSDETMSSAEISLRKDIGRNVIAMKSQEMSAQSEDYDKYTEEDLLSAAASEVGGYTVNAHWADSRTRNTSTFDSVTDEESMDISMFIANEKALTMQASEKRESESSSSDSMSDSSSDQMVLNDQASISASMKASEKNSNKTKNSSSDESEDSASISMEQKGTPGMNISMEAKSKSQSKSKSSDEDEEETKLEIASQVTSENAVPTKTSSKPRFTTTEDPDIDESLNAALANERKKTTKIDLTTVITTVKPNVAVPLAAVATGKIPGCPSQWTQFNTNSTSSPLCFRRFEKPMNFEDARMFCVAKGGHLASIHNERQLLLLSALLHNNGPDALSDQTWIGLNRIHQKYYVYEDETPMDFTRWLPGAPNINDCTVFTGNELPNYPHKGTQYKFGDFPCEEVQKSVLCELVLGKDKIHSKPTCEEGWSYYSHDGTEKSGKCYKRIDQSKKFTEAREICHHENSYLASIQNEGEARFVSALVQTEKNFTVNEQTWIGYVKYNNKDYGWEDGNKGVQFDPWTEKLPRNQKCTVFTGNEIHEDCRSKYRFVSVDCNKPQRSILCSKPPMQNGVRFTYKATENSPKPI